MSHPLDTSPGSELFHQYESDFKLVQTDISQKLDSIPDLSGEARKAAIHQAERALDEADEILGQMSLEQNNLPTNIRSTLKPRVRNYTSALDTSRRQLLKLSQNLDRDLLFGPGRSGSPANRDPQMDQRQQLLSGTERLERSSARLQSAERTANETEMIGAGILEDLGRQRSTIMNTHDTLNESERYLDRSVKTLRGMARRMATNKIITIAIITVLVLLIIAVIVSKFR